MNDKREVQLRTQNQIVEFANGFITKNKGLVLPPNYDVVSEMTALYMAITDPKLKGKNGQQALEICTPESIKQAVYKCITKGLSISKKQVYPIVRGNVLCLDEGSFGLAKQAKSICRIKINSSAIHDGDIINIITRENGSKIIEHKTKFENLDNPICGAYAVGVNLDTGEIDDSDIMTIKEIRTAWSKGSSSGETAKLFPVEMSRKTVTSRLAKRYLNTSDDAYKFEVINEDGKEITTENNYDFTKEINAETVFDEDENSIEVIEEEKDLEPLNDFEENEEMKNDKNYEETNSTEDIQKEPKTIKYGEYINNIDKYELVKDSYDKLDKTVKVFEK